METLTKFWTQRRSEADSPTVLIVGNPNVGKSLLFHRLTGRYVTVSNYPGTTVEVERGTMHYGGQRYTVIDAPGLYSLNPITEEERVARRMLLYERPNLVLHVVDAKNLARSLPLTLQLIETGLEVVLVLNMMDELERAGVHIDLDRLAQQLGIKVIPTVCLSGQGVDSLKEHIHERLTCHAHLSS